MKIYSPKKTKQDLGGGFTFYRNFTEGLRRTGLGVMVDSWRDCDVVLITGATMTDRDEIEQAKKAGKKIIFRIDNLPKDSRNRGTAFSRMRYFAMLADEIIFQSEWARNYVGWWLIQGDCPALKGDVMNGKIVYNGVDTDHFFYTDNPAERKEKYLYVQYNRDENKRFTEAAYYHHMKFRRNKNIELTLLGRFSDELREYDFDFFAGEKINYIPPVDNPKVMGEIMRNHKYLYFPAFIDASPNTVAEALACGCEVLLPNIEGGTMEIIENYKRDGKVQSIEEMVSNYIKIFNLN